MSAHDEPSNRELQEARWTAYALGQLEGAEREAVASEAAASAETRRYIEQMETLGGHIREAYAAQMPPGPSADLRRTVSQQLAVRPAARGSGNGERRWVYVIAATACMLLISVVAALLVPARGELDVAVRRSGAPVQKGMTASPTARPPRAAPAAGNSAESLRIDPEPQAEAAADEAGRAAGIAEPTARSDSDALVASPRRQKAQPDGFAAEAAQDAAAPAAPAAPAALRPEPSNMAGPAPPASAPWPTAFTEPSGGVMTGGGMAGGMGMGGVAASGSVPAAADAAPVFPVEDRAWTTAPATLAEKLSERPIPEDHLAMPYGSDVGVLPTVPPGGERYDPIVENSPVPVARQPVSTFSIDVDTASYSNVRRLLGEGRMPPSDAVRIEEMINYFDYDYPPPSDGEPFAVNLEVAQCPWNAAHRLLRVGLKGREIDRRERGPSNLVFLLDVSGSMADENKLPLVKQAMRLLVEELTADDRVAIVTYASQTGVRLASTPGTDKSQIIAAIDSLAAGGMTNGSGGIQLAYQQAVENLVAGGTNRVLWATDGDLNVGITRDEELVRFIEEKAQTGVFLTVLGFGTGNLKDSKLEKLADKGNGVYAYIDGVREARKVLLEQMTGSLVTIAKDVKLQIEFNPAVVAAYRLIGYENRQLAERDFDDDSKDAGEIGAGHTVTALYELTPPAAPDAPELADRKLKYQRDGAPALSDAADSGETATVSLRFKEPDAAHSRRLDFTARDAGKRFGESTGEFQFAAAVAAFGMLLRGSQYSGDATAAAVEEYAASAVGRDPQGYRAEFVELVRKARQLGLK